MMRRISGDAVVWIVMLAIIIAVGVVYVLQDDRECVAYGYGRDQDRCVEWERR